jgi:DNA-binding transcriptional regulator LsrR (DeoR family)
MLNKSDIKNIKKSNAGRKKSLSVVEREKIIGLYYSSHISQASLAERFKVSQPTISRVLASARPS